MKVVDLITGIEEVRLVGSGEAEIAGVEHDSRRIKPGFLYVAIKGQRRDGKLFAEDALSRGAAALAAQDLKGLPRQVPLIQVPDARKFLAQAAARITGYPDKDLTVIGVTGTNGKTTVTHLLASILSQAGIRTAITGTTGFFDGETWEKLDLTTPESTQVWGMLSRAREKGCRTAAMEISSHAIALQRVWGLDVDVAVFTNLTQDHLDFHESMAEYKETKFRLFAEIKPDAKVVINLDDPAGVELFGMMRGRKRIGFSTASKKAGVWAHVRKASLDGSEIILHIGRKILDIFLKLPGIHNASNLAAAAAAALSLGIEPEFIKQGSEKVAKIPGRMERVGNDKGFHIFTDYAHTPAALENLILAARPLVKGRIVTLFGCGGDRDKDKRPRMGKIAAKLSDFIFITSDNPRTEDPEKIIEDILAGVDTEGKRVIPDRREAIFQAVKFLKPGDLLLVAGKGHEDYQILGFQKIHFADKEVIKEALDALD